MRRSFFSGREFPGLKNAGALERIVDPEIQLVHMLDTVLANQIGFLRQHDEVISADDYQYRL